MSKIGAQGKHGLFGNLFDLNGDGVTDAAEAAFMFMLFDEMQKEEAKQQTSFCRTVDLDDIDISNGTVDLDDLDIKGI